MKKRLSFIHDTSARIPFSILGIFILLSSSLTTVYLSDFDVENTDQYLQTLQTTDIEQLIYQAEADIATLLNTVGVKSLQQIGKTPVITSAHADQTGQQINKLRLKKTMISMLNQLLLLNFRNNNFNNGRYALNVIIHDSQTYPIENINDVTIQTINMTLKRPIHIPLIGPDQMKTYETYWKIKIPFQFEIRSLPDNQKIGEHFETISKVITSRYPILYQLTKEYNDTLQFLGPFWGFISAVSNIYSIARGYKHYQSGKPMNIVDNKHLAPLINAGLLFEQGLTFGSVDPISLLDVLSKCKTSLFNKNNPDTVESLNSLDEQSFSIPTSWFSSIPSNIENNDEINSTINQCPQINISEIASMILYHHQTTELIFEQISTGIQYSILLYNASSDAIKECINENINNDTILFNIETKNRTHNKTTINTIKNLINLTYTSSFESCVFRDQNPRITIGSHAGYPINNGTTTWDIESIELIHISEKPPKGKISIDTTVYEERYDVLWTRTHHWSKKEIVVTENNTYVNWSHLSTTDKKLERNVSVQVIVRQISPCDYGQFPIHDVFYENLTVHDLNLEDTLTSYLRTVFDIYRDQFIETGKGCYHPADIIGSYAPWVHHDALDGINQILGIIATIKQNESINASTFSNPLILLEESKQDLLWKFEKLVPVMKDELSYLKDTAYKSAGYKAIYCIRSWFVDTTYEYIIHTFQKMMDQLNTSFTETLEEYDFNQQDQVLTLLNEHDEGSFLSESFAIPFGFPLDLQSERSKKPHGWNESLHLSVNQFPKYLSPFYTEEYEGKKEYFLGIRNICTLGSTGLPILPISPTTPWVITLNIWFLSLRGSYAEFILADGNDETIPHPIFGHDTQIIIRKNKQILDENANIIGKNTRISFNFDTVCFSIVPAWGMMVGDTEKGLMEEHGYE